MLDREEETRSMAYLCVKARAIDDISSVGEIPNRVKNFDTLVPDD